MYARGMTYQEIQGHLQEMYGVELSRDLLSSITDAVMDEVTAWQSRPLDSVYPVIYLDALWTKIRDEGTEVLFHLIHNLVSAGKIEAVGLCHQ